MELLEEFGLSNEQISKFDRYLELLLEWNEKFNLTAITDKSEIEEKHFLDSLELIKFYDLKSKTLIDIGSGAGFPGIPLAIAEPTLKVTLLEANGKKVSFLQEVVKQLKLSNVKVIQGRAEELKTRECYDIVTARAVKELNILLEIAFYLVKVGGCFFAYKGPIAKEEVENAKGALKALRAEVPIFHKYKLKKSQNPRVFLQILKKNETPRKYPRRYGEIVNHPL
jgi:16S rRNA (guanine527-N7)-methyltransferase